MIFVLFRYIPPSHMYHYLHKIKCLYEKDTILINLYQCDDFLLVLKRKHVYQKEDFNCMIGICAVNPMKECSKLNTECSKSNTKRRRFNNSCRKSNKGTCSKSKNACIGLIEKCMIRQYKMQTIDRKLEEIQG